MEEDVKVYACPLSEESCIVPPEEEDGCRLLFRTGNLVEKAVMYATTKEPRRKRMRRRLKLCWRRNGELLASETLTVDESMEQAFELEAPRGAGELEVLCFGDTEVVLVCTHRKRRRRNRP